ncbi:hypothetical protein GOV08_00685 [Candidatus Woesearchaeota archaeon]|nr:hypothetical protein [Candidatus Woesearchaeota archaeon]
MEEESAGENLKEKILAFIDEHKDKLGEDYEAVKKKIKEIKKDVLSNEDVKNIKEWIKKHPFLTVAFALLLGSAMNKIFGKGD